jgi:hypothetical protein
MTMRLPIQATNYIDNSFIIKLLVTKLAKKSVDTEPKMALPCSRQPGTGSYPEPRDSVPNSYSLFDSVYCYILNEMFLTKRHYSL